MDNRQRFSRIVAVILLLTFSVWQVTPYVYAETSFAAPVAEQFIAPENNPQTATMTPETSTNPDEEDYIEGYGPNDLGMVTDLEAEDETGNPLTVSNGAAVSEQAISEVSGAKDMTAEQAMQQELAALAETPVPNNDNNTMDQSATRNLAAEAQLPAGPSVSTVGTNGTVTQQGTVVNWTAINGATGYEVQISRNADFSDPLQLQNQFVTTNQFELPDFSQGTFYVRVRAVQGTADARTVMTGWSSSRQFNMQVTYPVYLTPLSFAQGGVDANILDWTPGAASMQGYIIYRRVFGTTEWELIRDNGQLTRFIDTDIDSAVAYQYQVRSTYTGRDTEILIDFEQSANYDAAYQSSIQPENVLVLINTNEMGYVDIAQAVPNADAAYGHLDPISETQLLAYLGRQASDWEDADGDGIYYLYDPTHQYIYARKDTRNGASLIETPLAVYYAIRRDIPMENLCFLGTIPASYSNERADMGTANFQNWVVNPIHDYMVSHNLTSQITSIVSVYHFPLVVAGASWEEQLNYSLWESFGGTNADHSQRMDSGHQFSRLLGDVGFLTTRMDAQDAQTVRTNMIDNAIYAEQNFLHQGADWIQNSGLMAFIDWGGRYALGDQWFQAAANILGDSGVFGTQGDNWDSQGNLPYFFYGNRFYLYDSIYTGPAPSGWACYRRIEGSSEWELIADIPTDAQTYGGDLRSVYFTHLDTGYIGVTDLNIDPNLQYEYEVRPYLTQDGVRVDQGNFPPLWSGTMRPSDQISYDENGDLRLDNTFLFTGWYHYADYQDYFNWAPGAIGWSLDSFSGGSFRNSEGEYIPNNGRLEDPWGANIINGGAAASLGAVFEPQLGGHTRPQLFVDYLLAGYSFAEAGYAATPVASGTTGAAPWMMAFDGDPLYRPFRSDDVGIPLVTVLLDDAGQVTGYRFSYGNGVQNGLWRDYDLNGRLTGERLPNGTLIEYMADGRVAVYDFSHSGINASSYHAFSSLRIYDAEGHLILESSIPVAVADFDHDEIRITENGRIEIVRHYNNRSTVDVFNQDGMLQGPTGQWLLVSTVFLESNANPLTQYESHGTVVYGTHTVGQDTRFVPIEIVSTAGNHFEIQYASNSFEIAGIILRNAAGETVLSAAWNSSNERFDVRDWVSGLVIPGVVLQHPSHTIFEYIIMKLESLVKVILENIPYFRNILYDYLGATMGLTREEIDARFSIIAGALPTVYFRDSTNSELYYFQRNLRGTRLQIGQRLIEIDLQGHLVSEKIGGVISRTFCYSSSGVLLGYQDSGGAIYVLADGRFGGAQLASEVVSNQRIVYVGYQGRGFQSYAEALRFLQDFHIDITQASVTFDIAAPSLSIPSSIVGGVATTLSLPWLAGATGLEIQVARDENFSDVAYSTTVSDPGVALNLAEGHYFLRVCAIFSEVVHSNWANAFFDVESSTVPTPVIQIVDTVPVLTNTPSLTLNYTVNGVAQVATFNLQEGENTGLQIVVRDANQNVVASYDLPKITLDTKPPVIVVTSQIPSITNQAQLTVTYTVDGGAVQTQTFDLQDGNNILPSLTASDAAGNQAVLELGRITLDRMAPVIVVTSQIPSVTNQSVLIVSYTVDGGIVQTQTFNLIEGDNTGLVIAATDAAGNRATLPIANVKLDTTAPVIVVTSTVPSVTNQSVLTVTYTVDGGAVQTQTFNLVEGNNTGLTITVLDAAGNRSSQNLPAIRYELPNLGENGIKVTEEVPEITNQNRITINYTLNGVAQTQTFQLTEGTNQLVLSGQDRDGKPVERTFSVVLDTVAPVIALQGELPEVLPIDSLFVTYTVDGESRMIVLPLEEGDNTDLRLTAMDAAGNESFLVLPNVRYEKPPAITAADTSKKLEGGTESRDSQEQAQAAPMSVADFRVYLQTRSMSSLQRSRVNQSLGLMSAGAFVYRYETSSGPQFSWTESTGRTVVFSFENGTLLFGELLTPILS